MREYSFVFVKIDYDDIDVFADDTKEYLNECDEPSSSSSSEEVMA
ncbi:hypothetical protein [Thermococcus kodakarensis]|nr:hypothetical protein [Thermococcus kodakarensis]WCN28629.1 hypothetical protein POG15_02990 [Thermococcus kodakarensis]WCN30927.1 hypothetical protein POG21_02990 [Thermococcus kodakarensis]